MIFDVIFLINWAVKIMKESMARTAIRPETLFFFWKAHLCMQQVMVVVQFVL